MYSDGSDGRMVSENLPRSLKLQVLANDMIEL
jgi:predicted metal-binding protein